MAKRPVLAKPVEDDAPRTKRKYTKRAKTAKKRQSTRRTKKTKAPVETQPVAKTAAPAISLETLRPALAAAEDRLLHGEGPVTFDEFNEYWNLHGLVKTAEKQAGQ